MAKSSRRPKLPNFVLNTLFWALKSQSFLHKVTICVLNFPYGGWGVTILGLSPKKTGIFYPFA